VTSFTLTDCGVVGIILAVQLLWLWFVYPTKHGKKRCVAWGSVFLYFWLVEGYMFLTGDTFSESTVEGFGLKGAWIITLILCGDLLYHWRDLAARLWSFGIFRRG
jgi:hypothetical protein